MARHAEVLATLPRERVGIDQPLPPGHNPATAGLRRLPNGVTPGQNQLPPVPASGADGVTDRSPFYSSISPLDEQDQLRNHLANAC
jgi:hypothetical protein